MATTTILLREDVDNLGGRGEVVKVKAGYARNYLIPNSLAMVATKANIKQVEAEREGLLKKAAEEKSTATMQGEQMQSIGTLVFERKSGEHGILYGSVTTMDIADALKAKGYEIDRKRISVEDTIKELGDYTAKIKLHRDVTIDLPIEVQGEGGIRREQVVKAEQPEETAPATEASNDETVDR